ncbi:MAG: AraC family transcriptional regulator [Mycobacteriaceae bacterium]|nr:AraC family transcriptional regulator [Mycobacteriaceae bacterium]
MASIESVTARPAPPLRPFIDRYHGYRMSGYAPGLHRGLPSRHMTFIVAIGPTIDVATQTDPRHTPGSYRCVLSGLQATSATIAHKGFQEGVAVALTPLGCRTLFGLPAGELWNTTLECADVAGGAGDELWDRLQGAADWPHRFAICDAVLLRLARPDSLVAPELTWAWQMLASTDGTAPIASMAERIGWTRQHLTRRFDGEFGLSPKLAARVLRFDRACGMLRHTPSFVTVAQVAASCGYYDQAHLNRDFAEFAGCSPTTWLATEIPSVQDDGGPQAQDSTP